jgi:hypothetical protein
MFVEVAHQRGTVKLWEVEREPAKNCQRMVELAQIDFHLPPNPVDRLGPGRARKQCTSLLFTDHVGNKRLKFVEVRDGFAVDPAAGFTPRQHSHEWSDKKPQVVRRCPQVLKDIGNQLRAAAQGLRELRIRRLPPFGH